MNRRQAAEYYLSNPDLLIKYCSYNNPQGVIDVIFEHYPGDVPEEGFDSPKEIYLLAKKLSKREKPKEFAVMLANSIAVRKPVNTFANLDQYAS